MADIELVIKIPEGLRKTFELEQWTALSCMEMKDALEKATPLPKGHGRLKDVDHYIKMEWEHPDYSLMDDEPTIIEADKAESEE